MVLLPPTVITNPIKLILLNTVWSLWRTTVQGFFFDYQLTLHSIYGMVFGFYNCGIECVCWVSLQGPWESHSGGEKKDRPLDLDNCNEWVFKFSVFQWCAQKWNQTCIYTAHASYDISVWAHIYQAAGWTHGNLHQRLCSVMGQVLHFQEVGLLLLLSQLIVSLIYPLHKLHQQINLCVFIPCLVMSLFMQYSLQVCIWTQ